MKFTANNLTYNRGGAIIGKSAGMAAQRNKLRRAIMGFFQNNSNFMEKATVGMDFVVLVGANAIKSGSDEINKELKTYGQFL